jgi:hypothetical protein
MASGHTYPPNVRQAGILSHITQDAISSNFANQIGKSRFGCLDASSEQLVPLAPMSERSAAEKLAGRRSKFVVFDGWKIQLL